MAYKQTSSVETSIFNKGMVKDYTEIYLDKGMWTNAINAINASHSGDKGTLGNEPSNIECESHTPYSIIGEAYKKDDEFVLFSTNGHESEIGIFNTSQCSYTTIINDDCLNFDKLHLITGAVRQNYDKTYSVYWQDNKNVDRVLNLDDVPYIEISDPSCGPIIYSDRLDCDKIRLNSFITQPTIKIKKAQGSGQLNNGSYMACIAYSKNGIKLTDYSMPSDVQSLWSHSGIGGGLEITISGLDDDFEEYELIVISVINQQTIAKKIGNYNIEQTKITLDIINASLETIPLGIIPLRKMIYNKSEKMFDINNYLVRTGVTENKLINYQPLANEIKTEWRVEKRNKNYYKSGNELSYLRDEVYSFFIRWIWNTGNKTHSYHIPGREHNSTDLGNPTDNVNIVESNHNAKWQVDDTSTKITGSILGNNNVVAHGSMGYWQSTEKYPTNNDEVWGDLCGKNIRHHKMPSNEQIGIYKNNDIYILGVYFSNIKHPVDSNGNKIQGIIGYEILRGSREGNRSIIAKGMFNNMWSFKVDGNSDGLYQNYPYNDLRKDYFISKDVDTVLEGEAESRTRSNQIDSYVGSDKVKYDYFSFHSPETTFIKPYLGDSSFVKIYSEEQATVDGQFKFPYKHPEHVLLTDAAFITSVIGGVGIGLTAALGHSVSEGEFTLGFLGTGVSQRASRGDSKGLSAVIDKISTGIPNLIGLPGLIVGFIDYLLNFLYYTGQGADEIADVIRSIMSPRQYGLQYNSIGTYNTSKPVNGITGKKHSRAIKQMSYIGNGVQAFNSVYSVNNLNRNKYVLMQLYKTLPNPSTLTDNTRKRVRDVYSTSQSSLRKNFFKNPTIDKIETKSVAYYGALKYSYDNQYGQISSIMQVPLNSTFYGLDIDNGVYNTGPETIFGGDTYINRYTEKNPYMFFNEWMFDLPNMTEFNYRNYINGPLPRYWLDSNKFDISDYSLNLRPTSSGGLVSDGVYTGNDDRQADDTEEGLKNLFRINIRGMNLTKPSSFHRLDRNRQVSGTMAVKHAYFYLSYNGIRDFYCESELNMAHRDYGDNEDDRFYDVYNDSFNNIDVMFRTDKIINPIFFKYDLSLSCSKLFNNFASWGKILPRTYDSSKNLEFHPNRAVYSLKQVSGLKRDNWRNYLPLNYKDFNGHITAIKSLNATGNIILFDNKEPLMFFGVDRIQTENGTKLTVGDAGLFSDNNMKEMVNADDELKYATCSSSRSAINTPYGLFWVSQDSGKIMQYQQGINEISKIGMKHWFSENLPLKIRGLLPSFNLNDNPVSGTACQSIYDPTLELVYFTKKDYVFIGKGISPEEIQFDSPDGIPYIETNDNFIDTADVGDYLTCTKAMDIAIVIDISKGNEDSLINFKENINAITLAIKNKSNNNYRICLITIDNSDRLGNLGNFNKIQMPFTLNNRLSVISLVNSLTINTDSSMPCSTRQINDAIDKLLNNQAIDSVLPGEWLTNVNKTIHLISNFNSDGSYYDNIRVAHSLWIKIHTYYPNSHNTCAADSILHDYASGTNGIYSSFTDSNFYEDMIEIINNAACGEIRCNFTATPSSLVSPGMPVTLVGIPSGAVISSEVSVLDGATIYSTNTSGQINITVHPIEATVYVYSGVLKTGETFECRIAVNVIFDGKKPLPYDNDEYWNKAHWTVSYNPVEKYWLSFHDWVPDLTLTGNKHFLTIKDNGLWKHNEDVLSYCNFYGVDYAFEVDIPIVSINNVSILRSFEYYLDVFEYENNSVDYKHILDANFDKAIIYNTEQISGVLDLNLKGKNTPRANLLYPYLAPTLDEIKIMFSKEEQKYRFNQFWDITKNVGEMITLDFPMWNTALDGVHRDINSNYVDYNKKPTEHKKFRHSRNNVILRKEISNNQKMILKIVNAKQLISSK